MSVNSLGVDVGGTNTQLGLVDDQGRILSRSRIPTLMEEGPESLVERVVSRAGHMAKGEDIAQAGVGIAGLIDHRRGILRFSPNLTGWKDVPLKDMLHERLGVPVAVGNDTNVISWGEYRFGGYGTEHLFCFTLGTGVGGGIVSDGRLILGANDAAGEFGHSAFVPGGPRCTCGLKGCLESYVSSRHLTALAKRRMKLASKEKLTPELIARAAREGDEIAQRIFAEAAEHIGRALGNVVQLLDPEVIVINGGISKAGDLIIDPIRESLARYTMPLRGRKLRVLRSRLGDRAGILGAAVLAEVFG